MKARTPSFAFALLLCLPAALAGCSSDDDSGGGGGTTTTGFVSVTADRNSVVANGSNTVNITVTDTAGGPVNVSTSKGTFAGGGTTAVIPGASGSVTLVTCNAGTDASCAGLALVRASHGSSSHSVAIAFGSLTAICPSDCTADPGCQGSTCAASGGATGTCSATTPSLCTVAPACTPTPAGSTSEVSCLDGADNDCDGDVDCADADCANQQCQAGSPTFLCQSAACTDTTSGLAVTVAPARTRLPANGTATTTVAVTVTSGSEPAEGLVVALAASAGAVAPATLATDADGVATFTYTAPATPAVATLTASLVAAPTFAARATITMPALGVLQIPATTPVEHTVLGATGSGFQEAGYVSVVALDDVGQPYPDGLAVRFEHRQLGGSTFPAPLAPDTASCTAAAGCVGFLAATTSGGGTADTVGVASAWLHSGRLAGTLTTTATATVAGVTRTVTLPTVTVVGAKASGANFSVVCGPRNVPALAETDCSISLVDAPFTCQALLKDRFNNPLGTSTQVIFASETAAVGQVATTPVYDPATGPSSDLGAATQVFETMGAGLPYDVAPVAGEPSTTHALDGCGPRTHNPRDGVATIVAVADGEEAFFDADGNGSYDAGEPFVDQGEPYVDQDDSGAWEAGEWFLDVDGDRAYTPRDGVWTASAKIWTQTVTVYTGYAVTLPSGADLLGTRWVELADWAGACTATPLASFAVNAEQAGPPVVPATSEGFVVVASDLNLNRLHEGAGYEVTVASGGIEASYDGLAAYADGTGMFFRYWPCDGAGNCASQCRSTTNLPCVMTPSLSGFSCGIAAGATITGGTDPDPGLVEVEWRVNTPFEVYGTGKDMLGGQGILGTHN